MTTRYSYPQAAEALGVEESWLRRHIKRLPHSKLGRTVYFTSADLERIDQLHHHEPTTGPLALVPAARPGPVGAPPHPLAYLKPLPARRAS